MRWSDEVVRQVASLTGPEQPQGVLAATGRGIGDLLQTIAVHVAVLALRAAAPDHALLIAHDEQQTARLAGRPQRLDALVGFPAMPPAVGPHVTRIAAAGRVAEALDRKTQLAVQGAGLKLVLEQIGSSIRAIRSALSG